MGNFGSNSNYFLSDNGNPLKDLTVTVQITEDIIVPFGFSIQLNAYSPPTANCVVQQYGFVFSTNAGAAPTISGFIDNWPANAYRAPLNIPSGGDLINDYNIPLVSLSAASPNTLPAGYTLTIGLTNDSSGNVIAVTYLVVDNHGKATSSQPISLTSLYVDGVSPKEQITSGSEAPILSFQVNIVGKDNGEYTFFEQGAGTINYSSTTPMTVTPSQPTFTAAQGVGTEEESNLGYASVTPVTASSYTQTFTTSLTIPPTYAPGGGLAVSQQFGLNQTDVFVIDRAGQLVVFFVDGTGNWGQTTGIGPLCIAHPGAPLAVSQQFGANNQTNVFFVDQTGQLSTFWVEGSGAWNGPVKIGPGGGFPASAYIAVTQQFGGSNQTDVFLIDGNGRLNVCWVQGAGSWSQPVLIGPKKLAPSGCPLAASQQFGGNQTDVFVVDNNGQLNVFWVDGTGTWNGPEKIGTKGAFPAGAHVAVSQQIGGQNQTDVFLIDNNGQLNVFWVQGLTGGWSSPVKIGPQNVAPPGASLSVSQQFGVNQTDVFVVDNNGQLNVYWVDGTGSWNGPEKLGPAGIAPSGGIVAASKQFGATNQTDVFVVNQSGPSSPGWPNVFWVNGAGNWNGPIAL